MGLALLGGVVDRQSVIDRVPIPRLLTIGRQA
jgi:hypothetical protein